MRISRTGAMVGATIGAISRSAVVMLNLGDNLPLVFVLPSAAIGVLVGVIAGATGRPLVGAVLGAFLSAIVFELFVLPCASLIGTFGSIAGDNDAEGKFIWASLFYALQMGVAGALAGGIGAMVGRATDQREPPEKGERPSENRDKPTVAPKPPKIGP